MVMMQTIVSHYTLSFGKVDPMLEMQGNLKVLARAIKGKVWPITKPTPNQPNTMEAWFAWLEALVVWHQVWWHK
jgi:hypothetical protein